MEATLADLKAGAQDWSLESDHKVSVAPPPADSFSLARNAGTKQRMRHLRPRAFACLYRATGATFAVKFPVVVIPIDNDVGIPHVKAW